MFDEEIEKTYLLKSLPLIIKEIKPIELLDLYVPENSDHPKLRLRKKGQQYEITKKNLKDETDMSVQIEQTIPLTHEEFKALAKSSAKSVRKLRYTTIINGVRMDIDLFLDNLYGLALVDFEFNSNDQKNSFVAPDFILTDVTQEKFIAGGLLAGKKYSDILSDLKKFKYKKLHYKTSS